MAAAQSTGISVRFADRGMSGARYESAIDLSALRSATDALYRYASAGWPSGRVGAATFREGMERAGGDAADLQKSAKRAP